MTKNRAIWMLVAASLMWSMGGVLIKLSNWDGVALNGGRSFVAAAVLGIFLWMTEPEAIRPITKLKITKLQWAGAVIYILTQITFALATQMTTAANAVFLQYTAPAWVALLSYWLLKERLFKSDFMTLAVILVGMWLFFDGALSAENLQGNFMAIASGVCLAFLVIVLRMQKDSSPATTVFLGNFMAGLIGIPFMFDEPWVARELLVLAALGAFQLGLPFILYSYAIKQLKAIETILIQTMEPIFNPVWVALVIGEIPSRGALIGGAIVVAAITLRTILGASHDG